MQGFYIESDTDNPYINLALEEYLLAFCARQECCVLYLWQNDNTVVIGRNQNAYTECDLTYAEINNIKVVRRLTGGGAVYHDLGNINFTVILPKKLHDISRSTKMAASALSRIGIAVNISGRNDICIGERKISGNAYYSNADVGMHHGTILYKANREVMERVLTAADDKLARHGVRSVSSRVADVSGTYPDVKLKKVCQALKESFCMEYGFIKLEEPKIDKSKVAVIPKKYQSDKWNIDRLKDYSLARRSQFGWGSITVSFDMSGKSILAVELSTDTLETDIIASLKWCINEEISCFNDGNVRAVFTEFVDADCRNKEIADDIRAVCESLVAEIQISSCGRRCL